MRAEWPRVHCLTVGQLSHCLFSLKMLILNSSHLDLDFCHHLLFMVLSDSSIQLSEVYPHRGTPILPEMGSWLLGQTLGLSGHGSGFAILYDRWSLFYLTNLPRIEGTTWSNSECLLVNKIPCQVIELEKKNGIWSQLIPVHFVLLYFFFDFWKMTMFTFTSVCSSEKQGNNSFHSYVPGLPWERKCVCFAIHWCVPCDALSTKQVWAALLNKGTWKENRISYGFDFLIHICLCSIFSKYTPLR